MVHDTKPAQSDELPPPPAPMLGPVPERSLAGHVISLALRVATLAFLITALISLGESL